MPRSPLTIARRSLVAGVLATASLGAPALGALGLGPLRFFPLGSPFAGVGPTTTSVALNAAGDAVVGEAQRSGNGTLTTATVRTRRGARGPWTGVIPLARPTTDTTDPVVAVNARGAGLAVFQRGGRYVAARSRGGTWRLMAIGAPSPTTGDASAIALGDTGRAWMAHALPDTGCDPGPAACPWTVAVYTQAAPGAIWTRTGDTLRIAAAPRPSIGINRAGDLVVAWATPGASARVNSSRRLSTETAFEAPQAVSPPGVRGDVHVAIGDGGDAVLGWVLPDAAPGAGAGFTGRIDVALRRHSSPIWSNPETVAPPGAGNPDIELSVDGSANVAVAWTTFGTGTGSPVTLDVAYRSSATSSWVPGPRLDQAALTDGEALSIGSVMAAGGRAFVQYLKDVGPGGDIPRLAYRSPDGAWSVKGLTGNADPTASPSTVVTAVAASAPDGDVILVGDGLQVRNFDAAVTPAPARASGLRVRIEGRAATLTFRLTATSRVHVLRRSGAGFRRAGEYRPVRLPAGPNRFRLGRLPAGRYLVGVGVCNPSRGCSATRTVAFRIR